MSFVTIATVGIGAAGAGYQAYSANKASKTASTTTEPIETPEQKQQRQLLARMAALRLAGNKMPEEQKALSMIDAEGANQLRTGMRQLEVAGGQGLSQGLTDDAFQQLQEANLRQKLVNKIATENKFRDEAYNTAMQIGLKSPQGSKTTVPNPARAGMAEQAGQTLGQTLGMALPSQEHPDKETPVTSPTVVTPETAAQINSLSNKFKLNTTQPVFPATPTLKVVK